MSGPNFDELVGAELPPSERERLRLVHDLLVAAGPPPELPKLLASPPEELGSFIRSEIDRWTPVIKKLGLKAE